MSAALAVSLAVDGVQIRVDAAGRYCLNDLHRSAGGEKRHQPSDFLRIAHVAELIAELTVPGIPGTPPVESIRGGLNQGTYVCKELVYAYAMWISAAFHLKVIRAYDAKVSAAPALPNFADPVAAARAWADAKEAEQKALVLLEQRPASNCQTLTLSAGQAIDNGPMLEQESAMSTKKVVVRASARIDPEVRAEAAAALAEIGVTLSDALRLLLIYVAREKALPEGLFMPNATTIAAMEEARAGKLLSFTSIEDLMADLNRAD